jgi:hypothetical protein
MRLTTPTISLDTAFHEAAILVSVGIVITCLEGYSNRAHYGPAGLLNWDVMCVAQRWTIQGVAAKAFSVLCGGRGFLCLNTVRLVLALTLILVGVGIVNNHKLEVVALVGIFILTGLFHFRNRFGLDGSDQMTLILCTTLMFRAFSPHNALVSFACLGFAALQSALAYATAGWAKIIAPDWRSGRALAGVMNTISFGSEHFGKLLYRYMFISVVLSWMMMAFEIGFPAALILREYSWMFLAAGITFHALTAAIMGLNTFFWSFVATYPLVYAASVEFSSWWNQ